MSQTVYPRTSGRHECCSGPFPPAANLPTAWGRAWFGAAPSPPWPLSSHPRLPSWPVWAHSSSPCWLHVPASRPPLPQGTQGLPTRERRPWPGATHPKQPRTQHPAVPSLAVQACCPVFVFSPSQRKFQAPGVYHSWNKHAKWNPGTILATTIIG